MTRNSNKSNLWKLTLALLVAALAVSLAVGAFAYAADETGGETPTPTMGTPTEVVGLQVDGYTLTDGYYRADGGTGDYAFWQGRPIDEALDLVSGVVIKDEYGNEFTLSATDGVTVTSTATSTVGTEDNLVVPFTVTVADVPLEYDVKFIADRPYALEWVGSVPSTKDKNLNLKSGTALANTQLNESLGLSREPVRFRHTSGKQGELVNVGNLIAEGSLALPLDQWSKYSLGDVYSTTISLRYAPSTVIDDKIQPLSFLVEDIAFDLPTDIDHLDTSKLAQQAPGTKFEFDGLSVYLVYDDGLSTVSVPFSKDCVTKIEFYDRENKPLLSADDDGKDYLLTMNVRRAFISYTVPGRTSTNEAAALSRKVSVTFTPVQKFLSQPTVSDLTPTYEENGVTVNISTITETDVGNVSYTLKDNGGNVISDSSVAVLAEDKSSMTFYKGGTYSLTVILDGGVNGNYKWDSGSASLDNDYQITYTITVSNAPVLVELTYADGADREYGDTAEPNHTVSLYYNNDNVKGNQISGGLSNNQSGFVEDDSSNTGMPSYQLRYYKDGESESNYTTERPTALGKYYVYAVTSATDKYAQGKSSPAVQFTINPRKLETNSLTKSIPYDGTAHSVKDFVDVNSVRQDGKPMFAPGENIDNVISFPTATYTNVVDTTVALTLKSANYVWASGNSSENVQIIITKVIMGFTVNQPDLTYGQKISDNLASIDSTTLKFGVTVDTTDVKYERLSDDGKTWTVVSAPVTGVWNVGSYRVTYKTIDKTGGTGGSAATNNYNLPTATDEFVISHITVDKVSIDGWSADKNAPANLGVYGIEPTVYITNWLSANTAPDGISPILTSAVTGVRHDGTTSIAVTDTQSGTIKLTQAGVYTVTVKLNSNYKWKNEENGDDVVLYAKIDKQTVSGAALSQSPHTYNGNYQTVSVTFAVGGGSAAWSTDVINNNANILIIRGIVGSGFAAQHLETTVTPNTAVDTAKQNGTFDVKYAGTYAVSLELADKYNYEWDSSVTVDDGGATALTYTVKQAVYQGTYGPESYIFDPAADGQQTPEFTMDIVEADKTHVKPEFTLYDKDFKALNPQKITSVGDYYIAVSRIGAADGATDGNEYVYLNYALPEPKEDISTTDRKVSAKFSIITMGLDAIQLLDGITGSAIEITYDGQGHKFSDYIKNEDDFGTNFAYLQISVDGVLGNSAVTNVKLNGGSVVSYDVTVTPAGDFKWNSETGLDEKEQVTFTITVKQLAVEVNWNNSGVELSQVYDGKEHTVSGMTFNVCANDDGKVKLVYGYAGTASGTLTENKVVNVGTYAVNVTGVVNNDGSANNNYTIVGGKNLNNELTITKRALKAPVWSDNDALTFNGSEQTKELTLTDYGTSVMGFDWNGILQASISGAWKFDGVTQSHGEYKQSSCLEIDGKKATFTFTNAGEYTLTFSIINDNFTWEENAETELTFTVNCAELQAPSLGDYRAMEQKNVADLKTVIGGKLGEVPYTYSIVFGKVGETTTNADQSKVDRDENNVPVRDKYYVLLTVTDANKLNYVWVKADKDNDNGFIGGGYVDNIIDEPIYNENGAQIKIYYAITASQVNITVTVNNYTYGANSEASANKNAVTRDKVFTISVPTGFEDATWTGAGEGSIAYTFTDDQGRELTADELINNLPWNAGTYKVNIKIIFDKVDNGVKYQEWKNEYTLVVGKKAMQVQWTFEGSQADTATHAYNGQDRLPTATVANIPLKRDGEAPETFTLSYTYNGTQSKPRNVGTYDVAVTGDYDNFVVDDNTKKFALKITPLAVTVTATGTANHIYGNAVVAGEIGYTVTSENKFVENEDGIVLKIMNGAVEYVYGKDGVATYVVTPVWKKSDNTYVYPDDSNVIDAGNYTVTVEKADFVVVARPVTIELVSGQSSDYGKEIDVSTLYKVKDGSLDLVDEAQDVFEIKLTRHDGVAIEGTDTSKWNIGTYDVSCVQLEANKNYAIIVSNAATYEITAVYVEIISVEGYNKDYDGQSYNIFTTLDANSTNNQTVTWYYSLDGTNWTPYLDGSGKAKQITNASESATYYVKATAPNHNDTVYRNEQGENIGVAVTVSKLTVKVTINLTIQFGEKSPTEVITDGKMYMATIDGLKTSMYSFDGFISGEDINNIVGLTLNGAFTYETNYTQGSPAGGNYYIRFVNGQDGSNDTLTSANYKFVASETDGKLSVNKLKLTVSIPDVTSTYGDEYSDKMFNGTTVTLPASTYTKRPFAKGDLKDGEGRDIYDYINDASVDFNGANVITLTTTAFTSDKTKTNDVGDSYAITAAVKDTENYVIDGEPTGVHKIISASLTEADDIHGYGEAGDVKYDEESHSAFVTVSGATVTTFVIAKYNTAVVVSYYYASEQKTVEQLAELDESSWTADMPTFIDKCEHFVYARIKADNHNVKYVERKVQITQADNAWTTEYDVKVVEWAYGLIAGNDNQVTEGAAKFTRKDGVADANNFVVTLTDAAGNKLVTRNDGSITQALEEAWTKGYFNHGTYTLSVKLSGTDNYKGLEKEFTLTVNKAVLTITAESKTLTYGAPVPTYTYGISGLTTNIPNGTTETLWGVLGEDDENTVFQFFTSSYAQGSGVQENGYAITLGSDSTRFNPANYEIVLVYEGKAVTVNKRVVTIEIDNHSREYNAEGSALNDELTFKIVGDVNFYDKDVASLLTSYNNNTQSIIKLNTEALTSSNGAKTNDVVKFAGETVGWYPIYAVYGIQGGTGRSWSQNYEIKFVAANLKAWPTNELDDNPLDQPTEAIKQGDVVGIGCYTISQATAGFDLVGIFHDEEVDGKVTSVKTEFYTGLVNYYLVTITGGVTEPTYVYRDSRGNVVEKVIDAGDYRVTIGCESFNYITSGNITLPMNIPQARLDVSWADSDGIAATIQYGESIPNNFQTSSDRFSGLTYVLKFTNEYWTALQQQNSEFFTSCLDRKSDGDKWTTNGYTNTTIAGTSGLTVTPVISVSDNFDVHYTGAALRVVPRDITVKVMGWNAGNDNATSEYEDNRDPLTIKGWVPSRWFEVVDESNAFVTVNGKKHTLADLSLGLAISSGENYNASATAKKVTVTKAVTDVSKNYNVKFVVVDGDGSTSDYVQGECQPTYLITKRKVNLTVKDQKVTYGSELNEILKDGLSQSGINSDIFAAYFEFDNRMFANGGYNAAGSANNKYVFDFVYSPYGNHVGDDIVLTLKWNVEGGSVIEFTNYEIENIVPGKLAVTQRLISAKASDTTYTEAIEDGHPVYNNGVFGAERVAPITFEGEGYNNDYRPEYVLQYRQGQGGWTTTVPNKAGSYEVKVILSTNANGERDYAFSNQGAFESVPQAYKVNKKSLDNIRWTKQSIRTDSDSVDMTNSIVGYVASIMTFGPNDFQKSVGSTYTSIGMGSKDDSIDKYWFGTVGIEQVGLNITSYNVGTYRITITLTDEAKANYKWDADESPSVTLTFTVSTNAVVINGLDIIGWTYGKYDVTKNSATFTVAGGEESGVQITYALITPENLANKDSFSDIALWYTTLSYSASVPVNAGDYVVRAFYPAYGDVGSAEAFKEFTVSKAAMPRPTWSQETVYTFNGQQQSLELALTNPLAVRVLNYNCASYVSTHTGFTLYATNAGSYKVEFSLVDDVNYEWENDESRYVEWTINKDETGNVVTWKNSDGEKVVYGNVFMPNASSTYNGNIHYYYALKDSETVPTKGWTEFNPNNGLGRINVDKYWVKAVDNGNDRNYNGNEAVVWFEVVKATLTITPTGYMTYGDVFETDGSFTWRNNIEGLVYNNTYTVITVGDIKFKVQNLEGGKYVWKETPYELVFETDSETDEIVGMTAQNYIIKSGVGTFTVNKRNITIDIGNASSQYGKTIDLSEVTVDDVDNKLIKGDDLGLTLSTTAQAENGHKPIGGYIINATIANANYNATINPGTYTITERRIKIDIVATDGTYLDKIAVVEIKNVIDDETGDVITKFVTGEKLTLTITYKGIANEDPSHPYNSTTVPTKAGTYTATVSGSNNKNFIIVGEPFTSFVVNKKAVDGSLITIANQTYTGSELTPVLNTDEFTSLYGNDVYEQVASDEKFVNVNTYTVTLRIKDFANYKWQSVEVAERDYTFTVDKANNGLIGDIAILGWAYGSYNAETNLPKATVKFGQNEITFLYSSSVNGTYTSGAPETGDVGEYWVKVTVPANDNYNVFTSDPVKFAITKRALAKPTLAIITEGEGKNDTYTGEQLLATVLGYDMALMNLDYDDINVSGGQIIARATNAGSYEIKLSIANTHNYCWQGTDDNEITLVWTIARKAVAKPTENTERFVVNGRILTYIPEGFDAEIMTISGNETAYGGEFPVTIGLKDKANYMWLEGGDGDYTLTWKVVGINTVFTIIVSVLGGASGIALIAIGAQLIHDHRRRRYIDLAIDARSQTEAMKDPKKNNADETDKTDKTDEGGNE